MFNRRKRKKARRKVLAIILIVVLAVYALNYSNSTIIADEYTAVIDGLPQAFEGYRIAVVADTHGNSFGENNEDILSLLREHKPDMIALVGDICDKDHPPETMHRLMEQLTGLAPVYYVTGNHEWAAGHVNTMMEYCAELGIKALRNEYVLLQEGEDSLVLAGIDDKNGYADQKTPQELMLEILESQGEAPTLLLSHRPDEVKSFWAMGYDLVLAGHVHGGVVQIPKVGGLIAPSRELLPEFSKGLYSDGHGSELVLSAGLAGHLMPPRLFNPLHLPIVVLKGAE